MRFLFLFYDTKLWLVYFLDSSFWTILECSWGLNCNGYLTWLGLTTGYLWGLLLLLRLKSALSLTWANYFDTTEPLTDYIFEFTDPETPLLFPAWLLYGLFEAVEYKALAPLILLEVVFLISVFKLTHPWTFFLPFGPTMPPLFFLAPFAFMMLWFGLLAIRVLWIVVALPTGSPILAFWMVVYCWPTLPPPLMPEYSLLVSKMLF